MSQKTKLLYVAVPEFQKRGAVHYHIIFFNLPFLRNIHPVMQKLWGQGFIFGKTINDLNHLANYVCKYIQKGFDDKHSKYSKRYFSSRGLKRPYVIRDEGQVEYILASIDPSKCEVEEKEFTTTQGIKVKQKVLRFPDGFNSKQLIF